MQLTKNFHLREFRCRCWERGYTDLETYCGGLAIVHPDLVDKLQQLRDRIGRPIVITSGYRCPAYNRRPGGAGGVGGARDSWHMRGYAADIRVEGMTPEELARIADEIGFQGIGVYPTFVHVDVRYGPKWRG